MIKMNDFDNRSSWISSLFIAAVIIAFFLTTLFFSKEESVKIEDDNTITIALAIFQKEVIAQPPVKSKVQRPKPKPIEKRTVQLTDPLESINVSEEVVDPVVEVALEAVDEEIITDIVNESMVQKETDNTTEVTRSVVSAPVADEKKILSQLLSLINRKKEYSRRAQQRGVEGVVTIQITLSEICVITSYSILDSDHSLLASSVKSTMDKIIGIDISEELVKEQLTISIPIEFELI